MNRALNHARDGWQQNMWSYKDFYAHENAFFNNLCNFIETSTTY